MKKKRSLIIGCLLLAALLPYTFFASAQTKVTVKVQDYSYRVVKGKVTDSEGQSLPGVNVRVRKYREVQFVILMGTLNLVPHVKTPYWYSLILVWPLKK